MTTPLRLGTRGSDLAIAQSRMVATMLRRKTGVEAELVVIRTTGDVEQTARDERGIWSPNAFVKELEQSLLDGRVDLAVHSYKDMATVPTAGLVVAAVPERAAAHDVLVFANGESLSRAETALRSGRGASELVIGTSSPRRSAQLRLALGCTVAPIRGNVPTRLALLDSPTPEPRVHAVCLAWAGLERLRISPQYTMALDIASFPTAAAQGALAVQVRKGFPQMLEVASIQHDTSRRAADAERSYLRHIGAGCHTPAAAHATIDGVHISLHTEYFSDHGERTTVQTIGRDPEAVGAEAARKLMECLHTRASSG